MANLWAVAPPIFLTWMFISKSFFIINNHVIPPSPAFAWKQLSVIKVNYHPININKIFLISQSAFLTPLFYH